MIISKCFFKIKILTIVRTALTFQDILPKSVNIVYEWRY